jgi:magnesium-transporting ATPase (P-type)
MNLPNFFTLPEDRKLTYLMFLMACFVPGLMILIFGDYPQIEGMDAFTLLIHGMVYSMPVFITAYICSGIIEDAEVSKKRPDYKKLTEKEHRHIMFVTGFFSLIITCISLLSYAYYQSKYAPDVPADNIFSFMDLKILSAHQMVYFLCCFGLFPHVFVILFPKISKRIKRFFQLFCYALWILSFLILVGIPILYAVLGL